MLSVAGWPLIYQLTHLPCEFYDGVKTEERAGVFALKIVHRRDPKTAERMLKFDSGQKVQIQS